MRNIALLYASAGSGAAGFGSSDRAAAQGYAGWHCDVAAGDRLSWTPGVFRIFGIAPGSVIDRREIMGLYDPASRKALERLRSAALASGCGFTLDARIVRPGGGERWMRIAAEVVRRDGRSIALTGVKRDITVAVASHLVPRAAGVLGGKTV